MPQSALSLRSDQSDGQGLGRGRSYLVDGSRLCMVVMKMRTMKAHTRFDLNTSSLIWEYCALTKRRRRRRRRRKRRSRRRTRRR